MRKILRCIFICGFILAGCDKDKDNIHDCSTENPLEELGWLKDVKNSLTNCTCQISIFQGKYEEKTVYYLMMNDPLCNSVFHVVLWDCNGDIVKDYKPGENDMFFSEVELVNNIYTCTE
jgi:hypothetical protein